MLRIHLMILVIPLMLAGCHSKTPSTAAAPYDSSTVTPAGKDSLSAGAPSDIDSLEVQIRAQDSVFEDGSRPTSWKNAGFNHPERFKRFLILFKDWVKKDQEDSVAAHIRYPIRGAGTAAWFKEQYVHIFNHHLKTVIARQRLDRVFRNGQGAMIGNGDVWFVERGGQYWVSALN
jgi:hypothetical protein